MTKKDYILIADVLVKNIPLESEFLHFKNPKFAYGTALQTFNRTRLGLIHAFERDNYRFDAVKFNEYISSQVKKIT